MRKLVIEGELYSSKNSRRAFVHPSTGKIVNIASKKAKENESHLLTELALKRATWNVLVKEIVPPYQLGIKIFRKTSRAFDYTNITQQLFDLMQKAGYLENDNMNYLQPIYLGWEVDKQKPRVEVYFIKKMSLELY